MKAFARILGSVFGVMMLLLAVLITVETLIRKFFALSFGGVDELGGYAIAIAAPLAFCVAMMQQAHIRINLVHQHLSLRLQALLNLLATLSMTLLACFLLYFAVQTVQSTWAYRSIAQTPWATPLIYPQSIWLLAMLVFALASLVLLGRALLLLCRADWRALDRDFGPGSVKDELKEELADLEQREVKAS